MFMICNKFDIGEEVYLIWQAPVKYTCPVCLGKGEFNHNGYDMKCPKCKGEKLLKDDKTKVWEVMNGTYKIYSIKVNFSGNEANSTIRYKVGGYNRAECNIFKSYNEAEEHCCKLNHAIQGS